ncbi:MFS general substrate transporter [Mycena venus]|uniref:MFS general substrate transporter n=1 Tax=Mycena venus TaxID=2733690 RepID=A0A8H7CDX6_9AGAR|nr:MFS general substrate transporter [Mycena venus]
MGSSESDSQPQTTSNGTEPPEGTTNAVASKAKRTARFWLVFVALCFCTLLSALDLGGIGTAAPTIVHDLNGGDFTWVSSAYTLTSAAFIPISGNMAQIFGRRPVLLTGIIIFAAGSAISGAAPTMTALIVGRAVQGAGGGMVQSLTSIVISDLVALRERGMFTSITGIIWSLGAIIGPLIAGSLSQKASWRWLFYLNLPLSGMAFIVVFAFLRLHIPRESLGKKLARVDWLGNALIMASASSCMVAITWGGARFPWSSPRVLSPLILGLCGLVLAQYYESRWPVQPTVPMKVLTNRTSLAGYLATFIQGIVTIGVGFYLPTWFQSVREASPVTSGLYFLPMVTTISPSAIVQGLLVTKTGKYRLINLIGWCTLLLGVGLLVSVKANTSIGVLAVYQLIMGVGMGFLYATTFVVLAPLDVSDNAAAVALLTFLRVFSQAWGVNIAGAILQNSLQKRIPPSVASSLPRGTEIAYAIVPLIPSMAPAVKTEVKDAFLQSLRQVWIAMAVLCGIGLCTLVMIKDIPLRTTTDKKWDTVNEKQAVAATAPDGNVKDGSEEAEKQV